jgi:hypothetical protein
MASRRRRIDMNEREKIAELITTRIDAGEADGGVYLALVVLTEVVPLLERTNKLLYDLTTAIAPDSKGVSLYGALHSIVNALGRR